MVQNQHQETPEFKAIQQKWKACDHLHHQYGVTGTSIQKIAVENRTTTGQLS